MKPLYFTKYIDDKDDMILNHLLSLKWLQQTSARKEYFMSLAPVSYTYGRGWARRTYHSAEFTDIVKGILDKLNHDFNAQYNVCFLNRYEDQHNQLGWHADDEPEMNMEHPIAGISFGAEREIWWKEKTFTGIIPSTNRKILQAGSLFVMPAGFQKDYFHRIPKCDRPCGIRISLTFRNYV